MAVFIIAAACGVAIGALSGLVGGWCSCCGKDVSAESIGEALPVDDSPLEKTAVSKRLTLASGSDNMDGKSTLDNDGCTSAEQGDGGVSSRQHGKGLVTSSPQNSNAPSLSPVLVHGMDGSKIQMPLFVCSS